VSSSEWDNGGIVDAGAVTWRNGTSDSGGVVSASNSLVGGSAQDHIGSTGVVALSNGHYVVNSPDWDNGGLGDAGAVTWRDGSSGGGAVVGAGNSLVGTSINDRVGFRSTTALSNGNYVVRSPYWNKGGTTLVGAATWRS